MTTAHRWTAVVKFKDGKATFGPRVKWSNDLKAHFIHQATSASDG